MTFRVARYGTSVTITTVVFIVALIYFLVRSAFEIQAAHIDTFDLAVTVLLLIAVVFAWLRSIRSYSLGDQQIVVNRAGPGKLHISLADIQSAEARPDVGSFLRVGFLTTQGLFGWAGRAQVRKPTDRTSLDAFVYGTNSNNSVVLQLSDNRTFIITPSDPEAMVAALQEAGAGRRLLQRAGRGNPSSAERKPKRR